MERESDAGVCMFNYECYKQKGTVLGTCIDGFLFGACCRLPTADDDEKPASSLSTTKTTTEAVVVVDNFIVSSSSRPAGSDDDITNYIKFGPLKTNVPAAAAATSQHGEQLELPQLHAESTSELAAMGGGSTVYLGEIPLTAAAAKKLLEPFSKFHFQPRFSPHKTIPFLGPIYELY